MENTKINENKNPLEDSILKILAKAELNGFQFRTSFIIESIEFLGFGRFFVKFKVEENAGEVESPEQNLLLIFHINEVFFNHNFAKAFFGDHEVCAKCGKTLKKSDWDSNSCASCGHNIEEQGDGYLEAWSFHLKKMVLHPNVIEYLLSFMKQ